MDLASLAAPEAAKAHGRIAFDHSV